MKIVIAPDKFKGSLSASEVCKIIKKAIIKHIPKAQVTELPFADGGDGFIEIIKHYKPVKTVVSNVVNPLNKPINAKYLYSTSDKTAYIELAQASGISLLNKAEYNPELTTTFGTGEQIVDALKNGAKKIVIGIGGSATNDAAIGMATALGYRFLDKNGIVLKGCGKDLKNLSCIDTTGVLPQVKETIFEIICDVNNVLYGQQGAAYVYAKQKGANPKMIEELDKGLKNFNSVIQQKYGINLKDFKGGGAAGGVGAGSSVFLNAQIVSGIEFVKSLSGFNDKIKNADWIITGEGKIDNQTLSGKVISGIFDSVNHQKTAIFCGINTLNKQNDILQQCDYIVAISDLSKSTEDSIFNAEKYLTKAAEEFALSILCQS